MTSIEEFESICSGCEGGELFSVARAGDTAAADKIRSIFNAAEAGILDHCLKAAPRDMERSSVTTSSHLLTLSILNRFRGLDSSAFYKGDPLRYVRTNLAAQRLIGIDEPTIGWPVYAFGAEALGQLMIYPSNQAPGSDPGMPLINLDDFNGLPPINLDCEVCRITSEMLGHFYDITGRDPVAHLPAPYSLAAEILGQEHIIYALSTNPGRVRKFLDYLVDAVFMPWCGALYERHPGVWLELSDASGSPSFVGPHNFKTVCLPPVRRLIEENPWGERVFVANYRGDSVADSSSSQKRKSRRRRPTASHIDQPAGPKPADMSVDDILDAKRVICPNFVIKLHDDTLPLEVYVLASKRFGLPLYVGIGATRLDRNSVVDIEAAAGELETDSRAYASAVLEARRTADNFTKQSWPGGVYIEDTNAESHPRLIQAVIKGALMPVVSN